MTSQIIIVLVLILSIITVIAMLLAMRHQTNPLYQPLSLAGIGILAFIADGIGVGSFAVEIALCKALKLLDDKQLPGLINGAQIIPGSIEAIAFLTAIHVDPLTLGVLVGGTCIGGIFGGLVVSHLNQKHIQLSMGIAFILMAIAVLAKQMHWLPLGGQATQLRHTLLWIGFAGSIVCGALPALGVGLFALVEILLFFLGLSPLIAFPIMTTAGALQQPLTTLSFVMNNRIPIKQALCLGLFGIIGVFIAIPLVTHLSARLLHWLLLGIICYNAIMMLHDYVKHQ